MMRDNGGRFLMNGGLRLFFVDLTNLLGSAFNLWEQQVREDLLFVMTCVHLSCSKKILSASKRIFTIFKQELL